MSKTVARRKRDEEKKKLQLEQRKRQSIFKEGNTSIADAYKDYVKLVADANGNDLVQFNETLSYEQFKRVVKVEVEANEKMPVEKIISNTKEKAFTAAFNVWPTKEEKERGAQYTMQVHSYKQAEKIRQSLIDWGVVQGLIDKKVIASEDDITVYDIMVGRYNDVYQDTFAQLAALRKEGDVINLNNFFFGSP